MCITVYVQESGSGLTQQNLHVMERTDMYNVIKIYGDIVQMIWILTKEHLQRNAG
jgi:hypothetical protein